MKNLTRKQLYDIVHNHNGYIALRYSDGPVVGCSTLVGRLAAKRQPIDNIQTRFQSFYPISFQEYIRIKIPYYT